MNSLEHKYPKAKGTKLEHQGGIAGMYAPKAFGMAASAEQMLMEADVAGQNREFPISFGMLTVNTTVYPSLYLVKIDTEKVERGRDRHDARPLGATIRAAHQVGDVLMEKLGLTLIDYYGSWPSMEFLAEKKSAA